ncbi:hypothetical protein BGZ57DRAFT_862735 [Hyaloscypha finlandica]|nr:hypothetical protein BGZ57DRAFT_862735 [Hyaloscypha finlandica]
MLLETVDIIAITLGLASVGATIVGNIIAYLSLKALTSKNQSPLLPFHRFPSRPRYPYTSGYEPPFALADNLPMEEWWDRCLDQPQARSRDLDFFDLVIEGDCETVAMHVSTWWLKVPLVLSDSQIQHLQQRCKPLFIAKSPGAALNRALAELNTDSLSKIFQQHENKSKILNIKDNGRLVFASAEGSPITSSGDSKATHGWTVNKQLPVPSTAPPKSPDVLPKLPANAPKASVRVIWTASRLMDEDAPPGGLVLSECTKPVPNQTRRSYASSKADNYFLGSVAAKKLKDDGIVSLTMNPGNLCTQIYDKLPKVFVWLISPLIYDSKYGAYTGLWSGLSEEVTMEDTGRYAIPWGRWHPKLRQDILEAVKSKAEGGTGGAEEFWEWCEAETKKWR